jgi:hypothetical protein
MIKKFESFQSYLEIENYIYDLKMILAPITDDGFPVIIKYEHFYKEHQLHHGFTIQFVPMGYMDGRQFKTKKLNLLDYGDEMLRMFDYLDKIGYDKHFYERPTDFYYTDSMIKTKIENNIDINLEAFLVLYFYKEPKVKDKISFKFNTEPDKTTISIFDDGEKMGQCIIKRSDNIFNKWNKNSIEDIENKIDDNDLMILYIIGISMINKKLGYGQKMIKFIEEFAKDSGFDYIALASTTGAIGFWKKMGYEIYSSDIFINMYKKI